MTMRRVVAVGTVGGRILAAVEEGSDVGEEVGILEERRVVADGRVAGSPLGDSETLGTTLSSADDGGCCCCWC